LAEAKATWQQHLDFAVHLGLVVFEILLCTGFDRCEEFIDVFPCHSWHSYCLQVAVELFQHLQARAAETWYSYNFCHEGYEKHSLFLNI